MSTVGLELREGFAAALAVAADGQILARAQVESRTELSRLAADAFASVVRTAKNVSAWAVASATEDGTCAELLSALDARHMGRHVEPVVPAGSAAAVGE